MATEHNDDSIICCMPIHTNRKMKINKTKIIIIKNRRKMVHVHQHNNTIPEKLLSESYPTIKDMEINSMWHTRIKIRLMVITDLQHMKKVMEKFTNYISDTINIYTVQNITPTWNILHTMESNRLTSPLWCLTTILWICLHDLRQEA